MKVKRIGKVALAYGKVERPLRVCRSAARYYLGTLNWDGSPCSRESKESWATKKEADEALEHGGWTQREHP